MKLRKYAVLCALVLLSSCADRASNGVNQLQVEEVTYQLLPSGARIVSGVVHNPTDAPMGNIQIQVSLFNKDNVRVDGLSITVRDIAARSRVPFRAPVDSKYDVTAARVKSVIRI